MWRLWFAWSLWVFEILVWESYKCIFFKLKKKKKKHFNWLFMKLAIFFNKFCVRIHNLLSLCKFILQLFCAVWAIVIKTKINGDLKVFFAFFLKYTKFQLKTIEFWKMNVFLENLSLFNHVLFMLILTNDLLNFIEIIN